MSVYVGCIRSPNGSAKRNSLGDLSALKVAELRSIAEGMGIDVPSKATKAQLIQLIEVHYDGAERTA